MLKAYLKIPSVDAFISLRSEWQEQQLFAVTEMRRWTGTQVLPAALAHQWGVTKADDASKHGGGMAFSLKDAASKCSEREAEEGKTYFTVSHH